MDERPDERPERVALRKLFAGRRGRLLAGLLAAEFAGAVQVIAYSSVLPLASRELDGASLYGATLTAGTVATVLTLSAGTTIATARRALLFATGTYLVGVALAATAPTMGFVLAGAVVRGVGSGLLTGFGMSVIGGLYDSAMRRRVLGLFAMIWLLPSVAGPTLNGVVASAFGWRWAMAWPAVMVLAARVLIGREADIVPWRPRARRAPALGGVTVAAGVVVGAVSVGASSWWACCVLGLGVAAIAAGSLHTLRRLIGGAGHVLPGLVTLFGLTAAFFGGDGLVALAVIDGVGDGVVAGSVALGAGLVAWSLVGLRPTLRDHASAGLVLLALGLGGVATAVAAGARWSLPAIAGSWAVAGLGMGLAYPRVTSEPFDDLAGEHVTGVATALAFTELAGTALGAAAGGGLFSIGVSAGASSAHAVTASFALLAVLAGTAAAGRQFGGWSRSRNAGTSSATSG